MKTFKMMSTWSLVVMFSFLQIMPTGWAAARPAEELQARGVSATVGALAAPEAASKPVPVPQGAVAFLDSTAFQLNESPLSPATPEVKPKAVQDPIVPMTLEEQAALEALRETAVAPNLTSTFIATPVVKTAVVTDPATGKEISVTIDSRNIATVTWGEETHKGVFDLDTNSILLVTDSDAIWSLQFGKKNDGSLYLQSFKTESWPVNGYATEKYTFNEQGQLIRKDWLAESKGYYGPLYSSELMAGDGGCVSPYPYPASSRVGGTIDYVTINGRTLVIHEKSWSENSGPILYEYDLNGDLISVSYRYPYDRTETESWYSYDSQGNLLAKNWNSTNSRGGRTFGQEQYVHINGRDFVSVRRIWQYGSPVYYKESIDDVATDLAYDRVLMPYPKYSSSHSETYYSYDAQGNMVAEVNVWEGYDYNGQRHTSAAYSVFDFEAGTWETADVEDLDIRNIRSVTDWRSIEAVAERKTVYVGISRENPWVYTHHIQYARNADGTMTAKMVADMNGNIFIVQGSPDLLTGETDDIKLAGNQYANGYYVTYREYEHVDENGQWVNEGYRLIFYDVENAWQVVATVDFPAVDVVTLDGKSFKITIGKDGILTLQKVPSALPPAVQAYVEALQAALGHGYIVSISRDEPYRISVNFRTSEDCTPSGACPKVVFFPKPGQLTHLSFNISADGQADIGTLAVAFNINGIYKSDPVSGVVPSVVHGKLLYEGLVLLMRNTVREGMIIEGPSSEQVLREMSLITVTAFDADGAIHFTKDGAGYRVYRDVDGTVKALLEWSLLPDGTVQSFDELGRIAKQERADGSKVLYSYAGDEYRPSSVAFVRPNGKTVHVQFERTEKGERPGDVLAIEQAVIDLLARRESVSRLILKNYGTEPGMCTRDYPSSACSAQIFFDLVAPEAVYSYEINHSWSERFGTSTYVVSHFKKIPALPPAVQAYVEALQAALGHGYIVSISRDEPYRISVNFRTSEDCTPSGACPKVVFFPKPGQLTQLSFIYAQEWLGVTHSFPGNPILGDWKILERSLQGTYQDVGSIDAKLLYEGLVKLMWSVVPEGMRIEGPSSEQVLRAMSLTTVTSVDQDGVIRFKKDGVNYKCYRNEEEKVIVAREETILPDVDVPVVLPMAWEPVRKLVPGTSLETGLEAQPVVVSDGLAGSALLSPEAASVSASYRPLSRSVRSFASLSPLGAVSALLKEPVFFAEAQGTEASPLFAFEQGSLLSSRLLKELTR